MKLVKKGINLIQFSKNIAQKFAHTSHTNITKYQN